MTEEWLIKGVSIAGGPSGLSAEPCLPTAVFSHKWSIWWPWKYRAYLRYPFLPTRCEAT